MDDLRNCKNHTIKIGNLTKQKMEEPHNKREV
jgi:hypothetical protein